MEKPRYQSVTIPIILSFLLIIITISYDICTAIDVEQDELGALINAFVPLVLGVLSLVIMAMVLIFSRKEKIAFYTLLFLGAVNLATAVFLKFNFKDFSPLNSNHGLTTSKVLLSSFLTPIKERSKIIIENLDGLPDNDVLAFSFVHKSGIASSDIRKKTFDHQEVTVCLTNNASSDLIIRGMALSDDELWHIKSIKKDDKIQSTYPLVITPLGHVCITVEFTAAKIEQRIKAPWWKYLLKAQNFLAVQSRNFNYQKLRGATCINTKGILVLKTDSKTKPYCNIHLNGLWQYKVEGDWEPDLQRVVNTLGFGTVIGFKNFDNGLNGDKLVPFSDEVTGNCFSVADQGKSVRITKIAAYHGCCSVEAVDSICYYYPAKNKMFPLFVSMPRTGQMLFPNGYNMGVNSVCFKPDYPFVLKVGKSDMERKRNFQSKIGLRIWKARDLNGSPISNAFILGADHLGAKGTNYDYQDEVLYIENVKIK